jgi:hypothetical protein
MVDDELEGKDGEIEELKKDIEIVRLKHEIARRGRIMELKGEMVEVERERDKLGWAGRNILGRWGEEPGVGKREKRTIEDLMADEKIEKLNDLTAGERIEKLDDLIAEEREFGKPREIESDLQIEREELRRRTAERNLAKKKVPQLTEAQLIEVRRGEEKTLNEEIQRLLVGLDPSIVHLMLINETELPEKDRLKLNCEYKKPNSGVVGIGFEEENKRVVYVYMTHVDNSASGSDSESDNDNGGSKHETLSSDKKTRILVGSAAFRAYEKEASPLLHGDWFYQSDEGQVFGPFSVKQMKSWNSKGFFKPSLLVRKSDWNQDEIHPIEALWDDPKLAFSIPPQNTIVLEEHLKGDIHILNGRMFGKLQQSLRHKHTVKTVSGKLPRDQKLLLHDVQTHGWHNVKWKNGFTLLHWACKQGDLDLVKFFVSECGALPGQEDDFNLKPIDYAKKYPKDKTVRKWLEQEFDAIVKLDAEGNFTSQWTDWGSGLEDFLLVGKKEFGMTKSAGHFLSRGGVDPLEVGGGDSVGADAALIRLRQQQEMDMNSYIQTQLTGLQPSLVELLLVQETALSEGDTEKIKAEYEREKAGVFGVSRRETYRMVFVCVSADGSSGGVDGDHNTNASISTTFSASDRSTRILVGSAAMRQYQKTGEPVKILNLKLFDKLAVLLNHEHDGHDAVHDYIGDTTDQASLQAARQHGWNNANWDQGFTLLHGAARYGDLNLCK